MERKRKLLPSHSHWRMNKTFKQHDFYACWSFVSIMWINPICLTNPGAEGWASSSTFLRDLLKFINMRPWEGLWVKKYTDTAFTVLLLTVRVSNPCLHKTSHYQLWSEKSECCRHFINQSNTRREKKHIKKLIHCTNYLQWVGRLI